MSFENDLLDTYADRENWSHFIHAVTVGSLTYILDLFRIPRQFQLLVHELGKGLHSVCAAAHTHKLLEKETNGSQLSCLASEKRNVYASKNLRVANLNVSKHFRKVMSLCAQAEVVENILLHGVQVGIFHLDMLSRAVNRES